MGFLLQGLVIGFSIAAPVGPIGEPCIRRPLAAYSSTLLLTLTNPMTILSFAAIFAGLGIGNAAGGYLSSALMVLGVFCGSALWWLILSGGVSFFRTGVNPSALLWVNGISELIIGAFGLLALLSLLWR